jgi:hypothetical protein
VPLRRVVVVALDGGCGAGVVRRLDDRTPLRSAMAAQSRCESTVRANAWGASGPEG